MSRPRPSFARLLGFGGVIAGGDFTGNEQFRPASVPPRTKLPGRGDPGDSLDQFSPEADDFNYDYGDEIDYDCMDDVVGEIEPRQDVLMGSLTALDQDCPSISNPKRFSF